MSVFPGPLWVTRRALRSGRARCAAGPWPPRLVARRRGMASSPSSVVALVLNSSADAVKFGLFEMREQEARATASAVCRGRVTSLGSARQGVEARWSDGTAFENANERLGDHEAAVERVLSLLEDDGERIAVVGHRIVHGGAELSSTVAIDDSVEERVEAHAALAPLHNPACLAGVRAAKRLLPRAKHCGVFDTAFHARSLGPEAYRYAVPDDWYEDLGVRRFGFHGVSFQNVVAKLGPKLSRGSIVLHLGDGGSSACCVRDGRSVDTSMGLTPAEGLVMGSRCGDIDLGAVAHVARLKGLASIDDVEAELTRNAGLVGVSGVSTSMPAVAAAAEAGDPNAALARTLFVERARKYIGAYLVKLGGRLESLVFTGSVGVGDAALRELICRDLEPLGICLDPVRNGAAVDDYADVATAVSHTRIIVAASDEEREMALEATRCSGLLDRAIDEAVARRRARPPSRQTGSGSSGLVPALGRAVYVDGSGPTACEEVGLLYQVLSACGGNLGYFRPFCADDDRKLSTVRELFQLNDGIDAMRGCDLHTAKALTAAGREDELIDAIVAKFVDYASTKDFVLVSRGHVGDDSDPAWTAKVASALGVPVVYAARATSRDELCETVARVKTALASTSARFAGVVATLPGLSDEDAAFVRRTLGDVTPAVLAAADPTFAELSVAELAATLDGAKVLFGAPQLARSIVKGVVVATRHTADVLEILEHAEPGQLVVFHASRADLVLALVLAYQSVDFPSIAGVLLSGTDGDERSIDESHFASTLSLLHSVATQLRLPPVVCVPGSTFDAANAVHQTSPVLLPTSAAKIEAAQVLFEKHLDPAFRAALLPCASAGVSTPRPDPTPKLFQHELFAKARRRPMRVVLPEGDDRRVVAAASELLRRGLCELTILGDPDAIRALAAESRADVSKATLLDPHASVPDELVDALVEARKHKGMTRDAAFALLRDDPNYYGTLMLHLGLADGMVSGACHSTAATMRPALQIVKMQPGVSIASSVFFMLLQSGVKVFGDCAINVSPDAHDLAHIAAASARTARAFGIEPRVALLSYATGDSNKGELIDKVRDATLEARRLAPDDLFEGPVQFDAAVDPAVAAVKFHGKDNPVAGKANVLIFPTLDAGNSAYKAVQQASKTIAVGPVMQGLRKPVNDLSRGCTVDDIVNTVVVTCVQAATIDHPS
mmetsp:Transcript_1567/g.4765  ORF Transcript_1567/g.4765 Transcript_1567/m.4765 type:complete len:1183 (+) Transcript_1567:91-3639(+)